MWWELDLLHQRPRAGPSQRRASGPSCHSGDIDSGFNGAQHWEATRNRIAAGEEEFVESDCEVII